MSKKKPKASPGFARLSLEQLGNASAEIADVGLDAEAIEAAMRELEDAGLLIRRPRFWEVRV